jgi:osmoprotectant transport system ATP-binding protein
MIQLHNVSKSFDGQRTFAVRDLSLEVPAGETLVLLGASGCGKTTTLKMINRLVEPTGGTILVDGEDITAQNVHQLRRRIGYAIQSIGLFPHMTIGENIAVVPRLLGWSRSDTQRRVEELLDMVGLPSGQFVRRYPNQLSGGQRQRIGVARALAADPPIILMDEPFGALDPITREQLQDEFLELESEIQKTIVFVTHDIFEAVRMGDRIALLNEGTIEQLATPADLVENPVSDFVEQFLGQHRFQLSMMTTQIGQFLEDGQAPDERPSVRLSVRSSLLNALDRFKQTRQQTIPVYKGKDFKGLLREDKLEQAILHALSKPNATQDEEGG